VVGPRMENGEAGDKEISMSIALGPMFHYGFGLLGPGCIGVTLSVNSFNIGGSTHYTTIE